MGWENCGFIPLMMEVDLGVGGSGIPIQIGLEIFGGYRGSPNLRLRVVKTSL